MSNKKEQSHEETLNQNGVQNTGNGDAQSVHPTSSSGSGVDGSTGTDDKATRQGQETEELEQQVAELTSDLQRLQAEFANFKRRESESRGGLLDMAKEQAVTQLLPVLDNIDRALAHRPEELKDNAWAGGVEAIAKQSTDTLKKMGVEKLKSVGEPFDHNLHEAISMEDGEGETEVVTEELQPGYKIGDKVIRHAMVKVGRK